MAIQKGLFQHVFDMSALVNIKINRKMRILRRRKDSVIIPEKVAEEINYPGIPTTEPLRRFISRYPQIIIPLRVDEQHEYLRFRRQPGIYKGEASAMAIALKRNLPLIIDERETKATGKAKNHGIKTLSWQDWVK